MTAVDDALTPAQAKLNAKFDQWNRYVLPHPETGVEQSWQRATTLAKMLGDTYALDMWQRRMVMKGTAMRPDLLAMAAAATLDEKKLLNDLCQQAAEAAGATEGRNKGSAIHRFTERVDNGETIDIPAPFDADVAAYRAACASAAITPVPGYSERIVVVPSIGVAGTFDRINQNPAWPVARIGDVKSAQAIYDFLEIAIQLAIYTRGVAIWDLATQQYLPMPAVDQDVALVFHIPAGSGTCKIYEVDVATGWDAALKAVEVREWRKRKGLASAIAEAGTDEPSPPAAAVDAALYVQIQNTVQAMDVERQMALSIELAHRGLPRLSETPVERLGEWLQAIAALDAPTPDRDLLRQRVLALTVGRTDRLTDVLKARGLAGITATPDDRLGEWEQLLAEVEAWPDPFDVEPCSSGPAPAPATPPVVDKVVELMDNLATSVTAAKEARVRAEADGGLRARWEALPADLAEQVDLARAGTVLDGVNLLNGGTAEQVALAGVLIESGELQLRQRQSHIDGLLGGLADTEVALLADFDRARPTAADVHRLEAITNAIDALAVAFTYDDDGNVGLGCTDRALDVLTKAHGNRATVLAVGREVARSLGRPSMRSAAEVAADPVVTALTLTINQTREATTP